MALKIPPLLLVFLTALLMGMLAEHLPGWRLSFPGDSLLAVLLAALSAWFGVRGLVDFRRACTTVDPRYPAKASTLVAGGVYRHSRNPMYLGLVLLLGVWALYLQSLAALAVLPGFVGYLHYFQILPEEEALEARFDEQFRDYRRRVRRWL